tara:strand:+ start:106 stop:852 length:747 start_codon:yes stop_codon:yes gene_type:complete
MDDVVLEAKVRTETGKQFNKKSRREGLVPAVVYGGKDPALSIITNDILLNRALHTDAGENVLITLKIKDESGKAKKDRTVLIKQIQHHPLTSRILHVDFNQVSLTENIEVEVPIHVKGEAEGVKKEGGRLEHLLWEIKVECLPTNIPERIDVDIEGLKIGDSIQIKDLEIPAGVKVLHEPDVSVVTCLPPVVEKEPEPGEGEPGAEEPEVIGEKKEGEEEEAAPEEGKKEEKPEGKQQDKEKPEKGKE